MPTVHGRPDYSSFDLIRGGRAQKSKVVQDLPVKPVDGQSVMPEQTREQLSDFSPATEVANLYRELSKTVSGLHKPKLTGSGNLGYELEAMLNNSRLIMSDLRAALSNLSTQSTWAKQLLQGESIRAYLNLNFIDVSDLRVSLSSAIVKSFPKRASDISDRQCVLKTERMKFTPADNNESFSRHGVKMFVLLTAIAFKEAHSEVKEKIKNKETDLSKVLGAVFDSEKVSSDDIVRVMAVRSQWDGIAKSVTHEIDNLALNGKSEKEKKKILWKLCSKFISTQATGDHGFDAGNSIEPSNNTAGETKPKQVNSSISDSNSGSVAKTSRKDQSPPINKNQPVQPEQSPCVDDVSITPDSSNKVKGSSVKSDESTLEAEDQSSILSPTLTSKKGSHEQDKSVTRNGSSKAQSESSNGVKGSLVKSDALTPRTEGKSSVPDPTLTPGKSHHGQDTPVIHEGSGKTPEPSNGAKSSSVQSDSSTPKVANQPAILSPSLTPETSSRGKNKPVTRGDSGKTQSEPSNEVKSSLARSDLPTLTPEKSNHWQDRPVTPDGSSKARSEPSSEVRDASVQSDSSTPKATAQSSILSSTLPLEKSNHGQDKSITRDDSRKTPSKSSNGVKDSSVQSDSLTPKAEGQASILSPTLTPAKSHHGQDNPVSRDGSRGQSESSNGVKDPSVEMDASIFSPAIAPEKTKPTTQVNSSISDSDSGSVAKTSRKDQSPPINKNQPVQPEQSSCVDDVSITPDSSNKVKGSSVKSDESTLEAEDQSSILSPTLTPEKGSHEQDKSVTRNGSSKAQSESSNGVKGSLVKSDALTPRTEGKSSVPDPTLTPEKSHHGQDTPVIHEGSGKTPEPSNGAKSSSVQSDSSTPKVANQPAILSPSLTPETSSRGKNKPVTRDDSGKTQSELSNEVKSSLARLDLPTLTPEKSNHWQDRPVTPDGSSKARSEPSSEVRDASVQSDSSTPKATAQSSILSPTLTPAKSHHGQDNPVSRDGSRGQSESSNGVKDPSMEMDASIFSPAIAPEKTKPTTDAGTPDIKSNTTDGNQDSEQSLESKLAQLPEVNRYGVVDKRLVEMEKKLNELPDVPETSDIPRTKQITDLEFYRLMDSWKMKFVDRWMKKLKERDLIATEIPYMTRDIKSHMEQIERISRLHKLGHSTSEDDLTDMETWLQLSKHSATQLEQFVKSEKSRLAKVKRKLDRLSKGDEKLDKLHKELDKLVPEESLDDNYHVTNPSTVTDYELENRLNRLRADDHQKDAGTGSMSDYQKAKQAKLKQQKRQSQFIPLDQNRSAFIYESKGMPVNLNGKAHKSEWGYGEEARIQCRHLAEGYGTGVFGKGTDKFGQLDTTIGIRGLKGLLSYVELDKKYNQHYSKEAYYFEINALPRAVTEAANGLWSQPDGSEKQFALLTEDHAMNIRLRKTHGGIIIYFYDPNKTNVHRKILVNDPESISKLSSEDLITKAGMQYFLDFGLSGHGSLQSFDVTKNQKSCVVKAFGPVTNDTFYSLMRDGHYGHPDLPRITRSSQEAVHTIQSWSGFMDALEHNKYAAVEAYIRDRLRTPGGDTSLVTEIISYSADEVSGISQSCIGIVKKAIEENCMNTLIKSRLLKCVNSWG